MSRSVRMASLIVVATSAWGAELTAQHLGGHLRDVVLTVGGSAEGYRGGIPSVTLPVIDSVDEASAASGELGFRGSLSSNSTGSDGFNLNLDGGVRQLDADGFKLRDYSPRVWTGLASANFQRTMSLGLLRVGGQARGRRVEDRTPIPLFLQPGYASYAGSAGFLTRQILGATWDMRVDGSVSDYHAQDIVPQLDLLDRNALGAELGASWQRSWGEGLLTMRFHGSFTGYRYPEQGTSYAPDPFRRDQTYQAGTQWRYARPESRIEAQVGIRGTMNRSNASRPEYNAVSLNAAVSAPLPWDVGLIVRGVLTGKNYLTATEFARLIPGEEADNASIVVVEFSRDLSAAVNAAVRVHWTQAETDIGDAYYERYGGTIFLRYRP